MTTTPSLPQAVLTDAEIALIWNRERGGPLRSNDVRFARAIITEALSRMGGEAVLYGVRNVDTRHVLATVFLTNEDAQKVAARRSDNYSHFEAVSLYADSPPSDAGQRAELRARITAYLAGGGLFNPEFANHDAVRNLLIDCRAAISESEGSSR